MSSSNIPSAQTFIIPDFLSMCPFPLRINPHYQPVAKNSMDWLDSFGVHPNDAHRRAFQSMDFGMLTAMCYPGADGERFRLCCDFINWLFAFDDLTDEGALRKDGDGTRKAADIVMEVTSHPLGYHPTFKVAQVFQSLWTRVLHIGISVGAQHRFVEATRLYMDAVHQQVVHRAQHKVLTIEGFIKLRRDTGALKMCFAMGEFAMGFNIPDEVFVNPLIKAMENAANDVVVLSNDVYSFNVEQAQGDEMNIIDATMREKNCSLQAAFDFAGVLVADRVKLFIANKRTLPSWGAEVDAEVARYLQVCENWMIGGCRWSLRSDRYFGKDVAEVARTRVVTLLPKELPRGQAVIPDL